MDTIRCGFAQNTFTPADPTQLFQDGYGFRVHPAEGIETELYVKAAAFESADGARFVILALDVCGMDQYLYDLLCRQIEDMTGLDRSRFALCATHTHAGPACKVLDVLPLNEDFWTATGVICGRTACEALRQLRPCRIGSAIAARPLTGSVNRRGRDVIDRRVKAAAFTDENGRLLGCICSVCCHPVINTSYRISADYPAVLTERAAQTYGVPFLFLQGRGADVNPRPEIMQDPAAGVRQLGEEVCALVFDALEQAEKAAAITGTVCSAYRRCDIPVLPLSPAAAYAKEAAAQRRLYREAQDAAEKHCILAMARWNAAMEQAASQAEPPKTHGVPLQTAVIGPLAFAFLPFELLTLTGDKLEAFLTAKGCRAEDVFIIGYANSVNSYLPPTEEFAFGGYEVSGATQWYGLCLYGEDAEPAVLRQTEMLAETLPLRP